MQYRKSKSQATVGTDTGLLILLKLPTSRTLVGHAIKMVAISFCKRISARSAVTSLIAFAISLLLDAHHFQLTLRNNCASITMRILQHLVGSKARVMGILQLLQTGSTCRNHTFSIVCQLSIGANETIHSQSNTITIQKNCN